MKKILISIVFILICSIGLQGCYNYTEINNVTFATSMIFDRDEYDNIILYLDCVRPYRSANESSDKGKRIIFEGRGKTVLEAIRRVNVLSSNKINFSQVRAYIFTEQTAISGIQKYMDLISNDQELGVKPYIFIYYGDAKALVETTNKDEDYLGLYLNQLVTINKNNANVICTNTNDYLTQSLAGNKLSLVSAIELKEDLLEKKVQLKGGVIMQNNKLKEKLDMQKAFAYNLLMKRMNSGTFEVANPEEKENFVTFDILDSKIKTNVVVDNGIATIRKDLNIKVSIGEVQGKLSFDNQTLNTMKLRQEERLEKFLEGFYEDYKSKQIDVLGVNRLIQEKYPKENIIELEQNTNLDVKVNVEIDGSSLIKDSL